MAPNILHTTGIALFPNKSHQKTFKHEAYCWIVFPLALEWFWPDAVLFAAPLLSGAVPAGRSSDGRALFSGATPTLNDAASAFQPVRSTALLARIGEPLVCDVLAILARALTCVTAGEVSRLQNPQAVERLFAFYVDRVIWAA